MERLRNAPDHLDRATRCGQGPPALRWECQEAPQPPQGGAGMQQRNRILLSVRGTGGRVALQQPEDRDRIQRGFGDKRAELDVLRQLRAVRAPLRAMVVVAPGPEAVESRHGVPNQIAVAQTASFLDVHGNTEPPARLLPRRGEM